MPRLPTDSGLLLLPPPLLILWCRCCSCRRCCWYSPAASPPLLLPGCVLPVPPAGTAPASMNGEASSEDPMPPLVPAAAACVACRPGVAAPAAAAAAAMPAAAATPTPGPRPCCCSCRPSSTTEKLPGRDSAPALATESYALLPLWLRVW